jgi:hypothetical protein
MDVSLAAVIVARTGFRLDPMRFELMIGDSGEVPSLTVDIRLRDAVVSRSISGILRSYNVTWT